MGPAFSLIGCKSHLKITTLNIYILLSTELCKTLCVSNQLANLVLDYLVNIFNSKLPTERLISKLFQIHIFQYGGMNMSVTVAARTCALTFQPYESGMATVQLVNHTSKHFIEYRQRYICCDK